ncbi:MAG TPA: RodZ domain-containing protein [Dongiaceae bacterium]|nr:RodZ domain-containing protein [Dongiaceae bacterium]
MMDGGNSETHRGAGGGLADIGAMLRDRRVELKQDIDTVARQTHIKVAYLKAIEEGRRRDLPGSAYVIGFVRTYADYLGFDGNRLVDDFHAQLAGDRKRAQEVQAATEPPPMRIGPVGIAAIVLMVAVIGFFAWGYFSDMGRPDTATTEDAQDADGEDEVAPDEASDNASDADQAGAIEDAAGEAPADQAATDQAASPDAAPTATPDMTGDATAPAADQSAAATPPVDDQLPPQEADAPPAAEQDPAQPQEAANAEGTAGKIVLRAKLESWVQVTNAKSEAIFSRVLRAGETYVVPNEPGLVLTTGNAGGIEILLDGKKLKSLGSVGLVRRDLPLDPAKLRDGSAFKPASSAPVTQ